MSAEGVTTALLVIAGIIVASMIIGTVLTQYYIMDSTLKVSGKSLEDKLKAEIRIVHGTPEGNNFVVFAKNVGRRIISLNELNSADVFFGKECEVRYVLGAASRGWNYEETVSDGVWSIGETLIIKIYNGTSVGNPPYCVKIVLPNGATAESTLAG